MNSPEYVQTSLAASMTLGFAKGRFHRDAKLTGLNLLLKYDRGCQGRCAYCGLSPSRELASEKQRTFIRVKWPTLSLDDIVNRTNSGHHGLNRVCLSMITVKMALEDTVSITSRLAQDMSLPISILAAPTLIRDRDYFKRLLDAGADRIGIAIDCATAELFAAHRGIGVRGPHDWDHYWQTVDWAIEVFGEYMVGIHLVAGLGESEMQMVSTVNHAHKRGALTHLFSFFPEQGSVMQQVSQPDLTGYRRIQLARHLINHQGWGLDKFIFDDDGHLTGFAGDITAYIEDGIAFMTSGCPGPDGLVACNRPFGNELPSQPIRNYPFMPTDEDIDVIRRQFYGQDVR